MNIIQEDVNTFIVDTFLFGEGGDSMTSGFSLLGQGLLTLGMYLS